MMQDTQPVMTFASILGKKVHADFDGGTVTSDGGVLFLRASESKRGVIHRFSPKPYVIGAIRAMGIIPMKSFYANASFTLPVAMKMPMTVTASVMIPALKRPAIACLSPATRSAASRP